MTFAQHPLYSFTFKLDFISWQKKSLIRQKVQGEITDKEDFMKLKYVIN